MDWEEVEVVETLVVAKTEDGLAWSGNTSHLFDLVFSKDWKDRLTDEHYMFFWEDVVNDLRGQEIQRAQVNCKMIYYLGNGDEEVVKNFMLDRKDSGVPHFLVMPKTDEPSMWCATLVDYTIGELDLQ